MSKCVFMSNCRCDALPAYYDSDRRSHVESSQVVSCLIFLE